MGLILLARTVAARRTRISMPFMSRVMSRRQRRTLWIVLIALLASIAIGYLQNDEDRRYVVLFVGLASTGVITALVIPGIELWRVGPKIRQRRRERKRWAKGLCLNCGYDLRETPAYCPECGTPAKSDRRQQEMLPGLATSPRPSGGRNSAAQPPRCGLRSGR